MKSVVITEKAPKAVGPYSQAVVTESLIFVSGQIPLDPKTGLIVEGDIKVQTKRAMENVIAILESADATIDNVIKVTVYLADIKDFTAFNEVYATYFTTNMPARSCVGVASLPKGALLEIDVIAQR
ncbi:MAG: RidA family protein [Paludibacteraceae bacterium]|nr:RidA family protein [Paludibacteraceae bacterium]